MEWEAQAAEITLPDNTAADGASARQMRSVRGAVGHGERGCGIGFGIKICSRMFLIRFDSQNLLNQAAVMEGWCSVKIAVIGMHNLKIFQKTEIPFRFVSKGKDLLRIAIPADAEEAKFLEVLGTPGLFRREESFTLKNTKKMDDFSPE